MELCESDAIRYEGGASFTVLDRQTALADCKRGYEAAVELFALLCVQYALDPMTAVCSHREGGKKGIASGHVDPEHYWTGLGAPYTMEGFRADVAARMGLAAQTAPAEGPLYRIQVGAFRNRAYAEAYLRQVQTHFPEAFLKTETV